LRTITEVSESFIGVLLVATPDHRAPATSPSPGGYSPSGRRQRMLSMPFTCAIEHSLCSANKPSRIVIIMIVMLEAESVI
jgi:hypothetical protein